MTDRELLELAARAAGYKVDYDEIDGRWHIEERPDLHHDLWPRWNPLNDDGDALRLAVRLQLTVCNEHITAGCAYCTQGMDRPFPEVRSGSTDDRGVIPADYAATRRAIVIAAAEIVRAQAA